MALDVVNQKLGIGLIARNCRGEILSSLCFGKSFSGIYALVECCALCRAVNLCRDLNIKDFIFEGDAKNVMQAITDCKQEWSWSGELLEDIKHFFSLRLDWQALFTYKEGNSTAHTLSRKALQMDGEKIWMEERPNVIYYVVMKDMACN